MYDVIKGKKPQDYSKKETQDAFHLDNRQFIVTVYLRLRNRQCVNEKCHCLLNCWYVF